MFTAGVILSCLVLSLVFCLVRSCPVLFRLVLSCLVSSCFVFFCLTSRPFLHQFLSEFCREGPPVLCIFTPKSRLGKPRGPPGPPRVSKEHQFFASWSVLGASWQVLGRLLGSPGRPGDTLGRPLSTFGEPFGAISAKMIRKICFFSASCFRCACCIEFYSILHAF